MNPASALTTDIQEEELCHDLEIGDIYLFRADADVATRQHELWILFQDWTPQGVYVESCTSDFIHYEHRQLLPPEYHYVRPATRDEVRDFSYGQALFELKMHQG